MYARGPAPDLLPSFCDVIASQKFSVRHALECKTQQEAKGGRLIISLHHIEIGDELSDLASEALSSSVCDEPKIHNCRNSEVKSDEKNKENSVKRLFWYSRKKIRRTQ
jgi:hypothetical protein